MMRRRAAGPVGRGRRAVLPIVVVGSINLDIVAPVTAIPAPGETVLGGDVQLFEGGKGANQAVGVARLGHPVHLIGRVGRDDAGARLRSALARHGVGVGAVMPTPGAPSGMALIATDRRGENSIVVSPGANRRLAPMDIERHAALIRSAAMVLVQLEIPLETVARTAELAHRSGVPLMLDPAPARELPASVLRRVAWLTPNEGEAARLGGAALVAGRPMTLATAEALARALRGRGSRGVIVTLGGRGACMVDAAGEARRGVPFRVRAVDSTAAGDAFNAGLAVALVRGMPPAVAMRYASAVAALSATRHGAQASLPTARQVARFLAAAPLLGRR